MSNIMAPPPEYSTPPVPDTEKKPCLQPLSSKEQERLNHLQQNGRKRLIKGTGFSEKALWDWLMLVGVLAIPVVVAFGTLFFAQQQSQSSETASERQHQTDIQIASKRQHYKFTSIISQTSSSITSCLSPNTQGMKYEMLHEYGR
jgi:hypothetical protein